MTCTLQYHDDDADDWNHPWRREVKDEGMEAKDEVEDGEEDQQHEDGEEDQLHEDGRRSSSMRMGRRTSSMRMGRRNHHHSHLRAILHQFLCPRSIHHQVSWHFSLHILHFSILLVHLDCFEACTVIPVSKD